METTYLGNAKEIIENQVEITHNELMFSRLCLVELMKSNHALSPVYKRMILNNANDLYIDKRISLEFLKELRNEI
jgi:hypothetical protein